MAELQRHILAIAFPAFGHIIPLIELTKKLLEEDASLLVTFAVSRVKVYEVNKRNLIPNSLQQRLRILPLHDAIPADIDIDPGPNHKRDVKAAMDSGLEDLFLTVRKAELNKDYGEVFELPGLPPVHSVISDIFVGLPTELCKPKRIPCYLFSCSAAMTIPTFLSLNEHVPTVSDESYYDPAPPGKLALQESMKQFLLFTKHMVDIATGIVVNSFRELEPDAVEAIKRNPKFEEVPVFFVGPLVPQGINKNNQKDQLKAKVRDWLNSKAERSVIYVSFGSMVFPSAEQLKELAKGLSELGRPVLWSLPSSQHKFLPEAVQKSVGIFDDGDSLVVLPWIPQAEVLSHKAVKVFVSHCGWNGTLEAVLGGVAVVAWPMYGDQPLNAGFLAKSQVAVMIPETSLRSKKIVTAEQVKNFVETAGEWKPNGAGNFFGNAQKFSKAAKVALQEGGSSTGDTGRFKQHLFHGGV